MKLKTRDLVLVALFAALTAIGAFIRIPIPYVPITLQFVFCAFSGLLLGSKLGALSQAIYVALGLAGLPIFTAGGGIGYIFNPTFGYLLGFILCAFVIGRVTEKINKLSIIKILGAVLFGLFFIYLIGVPYLYLIYNLYLGSPKAITWALYNGFLITIWKDVLLSIAISIIGARVMPVLGV